MRGRKKEEGSRIQGEEDEWMETTTGRRDGFFFFLSFFSFFLSFLFIFFFLSSFQHTKRRGPGARSSSAAAAPARHARAPAPTGPPCPLRAAETRFKRGLAMMQGALETIESSLGRTFGWFFHFYLLLFLLLLVLVLVARTRQWQPPWCRRTCGKARRRCVRTRPPARRPRHACARPGRAPRRPLAPRCTAPRARARCAGGCLAGWTRARAWRAPARRERGVAGHARCGCVVGGVIGPTIWCRGVATRTFGWVLLGCDRSVFRGNQPCPPPSTTASAPSISCLSFDLPDLPLGFVCQTVAARGPGDGGAHLRRVGGAPAPARRRDPRGHPR